MLHLKMLWLDQNGSLCPLNYFVYSYFSINNSCNWSVYQIVRTKMMKILASLEHCHCIYIYERWLIGSHSFLKRVWTAAGILEHHLKVKFFLFQFFTVEEECWYWFEHWLSFRDQYHCSSGWWPWTCATEMITNRQYLLYVYHNCIKH